MKKNDKNIIFINSVCASKTTKLVGSERLSRMIEAEDLSSAFDILRESGFGGSDKVFSCEKFGEIIKEEENELTAFVKEYAPDERILKFCLLEKDFYNAEVIVKSFSMGISSDKFLQGEGIYKVDQLKDAVENGNFKDLEPELVSAITESKKALEDGKGGMIVGGIFTDKKYQCLVRYAGKGYLRTILYREIDGLNISVCLRSKNKELAKKMLINSGTLKDEQINSLFTMNRVDIMGAFLFTKYKNIISETLKDAENGRPFVSLERFCFSYGAERMLEKRFTENNGTKPFMLYYYRRKNQISAVLTVLTGKANNLDKDEIRKRVIAC